jgi:hypothetical protein
MEQASFLISQHGSMDSYSLPFSGKKDACLGGQGSLSPQKSAKRK